MSIVGIASTVTAESVIDGVIGSVADNDVLFPDKVKESKDGDKQVYLNVLTDFGILTCPGLADISTIGIGDITQSVDPDTGVNADGRVCLGGATANMPRTAPTATTSAWDVWITDLVWNTVLEDNLLDGADIFRVAGFARMDISYDYKVVTKGTASEDSEICLPISDPNDGIPEVCDQAEVGTWTATQAINNFGFCGQGVVNAAGGYRDPWAVMDNDDTMPGALADRTNKAAAKVVFVDSFVAFALDCAQGDIFAYNVAVGAVNQVTCSDQQNPDLLEPVPSVVCFFQMPVGGSNCLGTGLTTIGVPGLIGTIGWRHVDDSNKCHETPFDQPVNDFQGGTIATKDLPPAPAPEPDCPDYWRHYDCEGYPE